MTAKEPFNYEQELLTQLRMQALLLTRIQRFTAELGSIAFSLSMSHFLADKYVNMRTGERVKELDDKLNEAIKEFKAIEALVEVALDNTEKDILGLIGEGKQ